MKKLLDYGDGCEVVDGSKDGRNEDDVRARDAEEDGNKGADGEVADGSDDDDGDDDVDRGNDEEEYFMITDVDDVK